MCITSAQVQLVLAYCKIACSHPNSILKYFGQMMNLSNVYFGVALVAVPKWKKLSELFDIIQYVSVLIGQL